MNEEGEVMVLGGELDDGPCLRPDEVVCALEQVGRYTKVIYVDDEGRFEAFFIARRRGWLSGWHASTCDGIGVLTRA